MSTKMSISEKIVAFIITILLTLYCGYTVTMLWEWFIGPLFPLAVQKISMIQGIGLNLVVLFFAARANGKVITEFDNSLEATKQKIIVNFTLCTVSLGCGFIYFQFM
jgi:hypothetical protein